MTNRRTFLLTAAAGALVPAAGLARVAGAASGAWSAEALAIARPVAQAVARHPFVAGVFAGTLPRETLAGYLQQNLAYLDNYARVLDALSGRMNREGGPGGSAQSFSVWAQETRDLRTWTADYILRLTGAKTLPDAAAEPAAQSYIAYESRYCADASPAAAVASALPCFLIWDEFGRALRPTARIEGNPFREWVEGMGSEAAAQSARRILAIADHFAARESQAGRARMTDVFAASCWHEWMFFDAMMR